MVMDDTIKSIPDTQQYMECQKSQILLKKRDIKNRANELIYEDRLYVLEILKQLPETKIIENADGCRINLDNLTIDIINKIHHIIKLKLKIPHDNLI